MSRLIFLLALAVLLAAGCAAAVQPAAPLGPGATVSGGTITDGADIAAVTWQAAGAGERIEIAIGRWPGYTAADTPPVPLETPCHYRLTAESHPYGLRLVFGGTRGFSAYRTLPELNRRLRRATLVRAIYPAVVLDDSAGELVIALRGPFIFSVSEKQRPARIIITLSPDRVPPEARKRFSLRTASGTAGEAAGHLREQLAAATGAWPRWLADGQGQPLLEAGLFEQESAALAARDELQQLVPAATLLIEQRGPAATPAPLSAPPRLPPGEA